MRFPVKPVDEGLRVGNIRRFLWSKLWLWLAALPLVALIFGACVFIPLGVPVFNLIYVGFISGYGLLLIILFKGSSDFSEEISANKYPEYKDYQRSVPRFIPFLKKIL